MHAARLPQRLRDFCRRVGGALLGAGGRGWRAATRGGRAATRRWGELAALLVLLALILDADGPRRTPTEEAIAHDRFALVEWVALNLAGEVRDAAFDLLPGVGLREGEGRDAFARYFALGGEARGIDGALAMAVAQGGAGANPRADALQSQRDALRAQRDALASDVESHVGGAVADTLRAAGLERDWGPLHPIFPPVSFAMTRVPRLIVVSPRERIAREETHLLAADTTPSRMEALEAQAGPAQDRSALVTRIGGVATFPALVSDRLSARSAVRTVAHEWLHHYFFFHPLGRAYFDSAEMATLNETAADLAGVELGDMALALLGVPPPSPAATTTTRDDDAPPAFDFAAAMRETRARADALLAAGRVDDAEAYMEARRRLFVEHGYAIRVLNQAYFAFHGAYAESPASVSPIGAQVRRLRDQSDGVGDFVRRVREFGDYQSFLDHLATLPAATTG